MQHRNPEAMLRNVMAAIPQWYFLTANRIYRRQQKPRLPRQEVEDLCEALSLRGVVEFHQFRGLRYYRKRKNLLAPKADRDYNETTQEVRVEHPRPRHQVSKHVDWFSGTLAPLRNDKPVRLWMHVPKAKVGKKSERGEQLRLVRRFVAVIPGTQLGLPRGTFLISIIGAGSCIIEPGAHKVANLVLAGMPAKLAQELVQRINKVMKE